MSDNGVVLRGNTRLRPLPKEYRFYVNLTINSAPKQRIYSDLLGYPKWIG